MTWKAVPILVGFLAFGVGTWHFMAPVQSLVAPDMPAPAPAPPVVEQPAAPAIPSTVGKEVVQPPAEVDGRLTRANYDRIRDGMTEDEVTAILGKPSEVKIKTDSSTNLDREVKTLRWLQRTPHVVIEIDFVNDRSGGKVTTLPRAPTLGRLGDSSFKALRPIAAAIGAANVSRANFDRIENGMTEEQVLAILGPPSGTSTKKGTFNGQPFITRVLRWKRRNPDLTITVTLKTERVTGKNCN